jgi:hypothetical protein
VAIELKVGRFIVQPRQRQRKLLFSKRTGSTGWGAIEIQVLRATAGSLRL